MAEVMTARSTLSDGMQFVGVAGSGHTVVMDAAEPHGGQGAGFRPMELLLVGLAGCTGMDVISILRKQHQHVTHYEVCVRGERAEEHPMVFTSITVEHIVTGHRLDPAAVSRAVDLSATRYCGAGAMLRQTARLTHTCQVREAPTCEASVSVASTCS
jgi:putative redox protein